MSEIELPRRGERMDFTNTAATIQDHLCRYTWALKHCMNKQVLDACCGTGYGARLLATVATRVVGVDIAEAAIATAQAFWSAPNIMWRQCAIEDLSAQDPFDTVVCLEALEHLDDMEVGLAKLLALTAPGGLLLLSVPVHQGQNPWHHGRDYSVADWDAFMGGRGLHVTRFYQPFGKDGAETSNCDIRYRINSTVATSGYALYLARKASA